MSVSWRGVFPAVTTQFRADGALDLASTQRGVEEQIRAGVHGLIMLGSVGENCSLDPQEKRQILAATKEVAARKVPVLSGVAEYTTSQSAAFARDCEKIGIDGLMVLPGMGVISELIAPCAFNRGQRIPRMKQDAIGGLMYACTLCR